MFRDSGGFDRFFPSDGDFKAHRELLAEVPNLDTFAEAHSLLGPQIKTSLGNTLRLLRPLIYPGRRTQGVQPQRPRHARRLQPPAPSSNSPPRRRAKQT